MATTFLEPGGDADFAVNTTTANGGGFWNAKTGAPSVATDFVHGSHINSIKYAVNSTDSVTVTGGVVAGGARISLYIYLNALPTTNSSNIFKVFRNTGAVDVLTLIVTTGGVLQLFANSIQVGSNGSTLSTGVWYRVSLAYTIASTTVNEFRLFKNAVLDISVTNATLASAGPQTVILGPGAANTTFDLRTSDHYIDNSNALTDPGNIWVTAKRPNANGTTNGFSTQIGAGGSGYGSGHSPQVNERPLSTTNGWSMIGAGSAVTEEYNIESKSTGDIDISTATMVDWVGWISTKALVGETVNIILDGVNVAQAITTTITVFTKVKGSTTYPSGTGADIGMITDTSLTTVSLYESGIIVAYIPAASTTHNLTILGVGT